MKRSEVLAWLQANGGQKSYDVEYEPYEAPGARAGTSEKRYRKRVTWVANNGQVLSVYDYGETSNQIRNPEEPGNIESGGTDGSGPEPVYELAGSSPTEKDKERKETRTPEAIAKDQEDDRERQRNRQDPRSGRYETDKERHDRERQERLDQENAQARQQQQNESATRLQNEQERLQLEKDRAAREQARQDREQAEAQQRGERENRRLTLEEERAQREAEKWQEEQRKPTYLSPITEDQETVARYDKETGQIVADKNPIFNEIKAAAKRKQEELSTAIALNRETRESAAAKYNQWFKENVEIPFMQAQERRAQATEQRQAQQAEEQRKQFQATHELERAKFGQQQANMMLDAEMALNPYRVGPAFGDQMSSAINGLAAGGKIDGPAANAGVNFTADAFEYKKPNLEKIASKATSNALKHLTTYRPDSTEFATANYEGINMPTPTTFQNAPTMPDMIDTGSMFQQLYNNNPYNYGGTTPAP